MKTCDEMVNSLLERREHYMIEQKQKGKRFSRTMTSICCVCLVALLGWGVWQGNRCALPPDQTEGTSVANPAVSNKIIVHQMDGIPEDRVKNNICLLWDDYVEMTKAEANEYYGINVSPLLPDDIKEREDQRFGIYRRNGGTGEVYWAGQVLNYSNEDFSRSVNVEFNTDAFPLCDYHFFDPADEKSIINNTEVAIAQSDKGYYFAQFMCHHVGFQVVAEGLTQDEFVAVISSLIQ